ncbi:MAG: hypothetical protein AB1817_11285 [Chloroflexota bacterium]
MPSRRADPKFKKQQAQGALPTWAVAIGIGILVIVGVVGLFMLQTPAAPTYSPSSVTAIGKTKGDPNAKVEFVVFSDFK